MVGACLAAIAIISPVAAAEYTSAYTSLNLDDCLLLQADDYGASFACPGYKGYPLWVAEGDLRFFVSYGFDAPNKTAAHQTLPQFNTVGSTLEWRLSNESGDWKPIATILRWHTQIGDGSEPDGETLIVTKIGETDSCHVVYIDARMTPNANVVARQWADGAAQNFDCENEDVYFEPS